MDTGSGPTGRSCTYELVFAPLHQGRSFAFPCDATGAVELNDLSERARNNYLLARALVGRHFQMPTVVCSAR